MVHFQINTKRGDYAPVADPRRASFVAPVDVGSGELLEPDRAGGYDVMPYPPKVNIEALSRWLQATEAS